ncbi:hypothetical protein [Croceibacter atlanticus]|jgi:hypothetical protein|uniref:Uncharacterized protein n=1 Tax=Croceibacter atlanticus (strain ATCC BAA-628 / JCM 21780 / CIP 108009 / IAM 15332 / KCTC 12090 / HTCC2559) TaxID=216432 RepID=A3U6S7_CROAH|nr:hypothetical protein [Croceibacter atlanticus]EAP87944.1 hypothetical protein CA2559_04275 [Croceibacter atlanticus HTCC2559]
MLDQIKDIALYLVLGLIINLLSFFLANDYLVNYLLDNLITIQLTLLAINTATSGLVVSKMQDIKKENPHLDLKPISKSLLDSLKEQIILIIVAIALLIIIDSQITEKLEYTKYFDFGLEVFLIGVFINSVQILWDTGKAIFVMIDMTNTD